MYGGEELATASNLPAARRTWQTL